MYHAVLVALNKNIEEEVTLIINGFKLVCFATVCPFKITIGNHYLVSFNYMIIDDFKYDIQINKREEIHIERINESYGYYLTGQLKGDILDCGIQFKDELFLSDYFYLDQKFITLKIDRLDVAFEEVL